MRKLNVKTVKEPSGVIKAFSTMSSTIEKIHALNVLAKNINPTIIYNEGWMIRLLVIESMIEKLNIEGIDFEMLATKNWSSESLINSPFVKAKKYRESHTHADIILGDFKIDYGKRGEIELKKDSPKILGIIEAKMGSPLSSRTKNAEDYNQASRNVCCLSYITKRNPDCEIFFVVAAPEATIKKHEIENQINRNTIESQIDKRFKDSQEDYLPEIQRQVKNCKILSISYEEWIKELKDNKVEEQLKYFYSECLLHNKIKPNK